MKQTEKLSSSIHTSIEHKTLQKEGYSVHYFVGGNREGEAIVFLHPAFGDHTCFDRQIDYFAQDFCVITVDMLGHGLTGVGKTKDKISSTPFHIAEILMLENIEKANFVGVSIGSLLVQDFALKYPGKTLSLTALGGYSINKVQKEIAKAQRSEVFKWLFKMLFSMDAFRRYVASVSVIDKIEQAHFYESAKHFTRKSFTVMSGLDKLIVDRPNIDCHYPLLILSGERDVDLSIKTAKQWHASIPTSQVFIIENAGHCANMDNSAKFNELLMEFFNENKSRR